MLYGNNEINKKILEEITLCEMDQGIKVIYGANVGGISKGLQYKDSDYDTRFLYINRDFPEKIYEPQNIIEKEIIGSILKIHLLNGFRFGNFLLLFSF